MAVVALAVALPLAILIGSNGGGDSGSSEVEAPRLGETKFNRSLGVRLQLPRGWRRKSERGVLRLRSKNGGTRIAISAPGPAADADRLYRETLAELRRAYRSFKVVREQRSELGGLRSRVAVVEAKSRAGGNE